MRKSTLFVVSATVLLLGVGGAALYILPSGAGEYRTSPDRRFCARATTLGQHRLFGSDRRFQRFEISTGPCERGSGAEADRTVWRVEYEPAADALLDYGTRDARFTAWSADSAQVTFRLDATRRLTIPVP